MEVPLVAVKRELPECSVCEKTFNSYAGLSNHLKTHIKKCEPVGVLCEKCSKEFRSNHYLNRHLQNCSSEYSRKKCFVCGICGLETVYLKDHYRTQHNIQVEKEYYEFKNKDIFLEWKDNIERATVSRFVRHRGTIVDKQGVRRTYFNCHRGGFFVKRGNNQRQFKATGSNKINGHCPAAIVLKECDGKITASFIKTHVGHGSDYKRIPLSKVEKDTIAKKLANNVSVDEILTEVKDSISDENVSRIHFINRKDIRNIRARHKLCNQQLGKSDNAPREFKVEHKPNPSSSTVNSLECSSEVPAEEVEIKEDEKPLEVVLLETNSVDVDSLKDLNRSVSKQFGRRVKLTIPNQRTDDVNTVHREHSVSECNVLKQSSGTSVLNYDVEGREYNTPVAYYEVQVEDSQFVDTNPIDTSSNVSYSMIDPGSVVYVEYESTEDEDLENLRDKAMDQFHSLLQTADTKEKLLVVLDQITQLNNSMSHLGGCSNV